MTEAEEEEAEREEEEKEEERERISKEALKGQEGARS